MGVHVEAASSIAIAFAISPFDHASKYSRRRNVDATLMFSSLLTHRRQTARTDAGGMGLAALCMLSRHESH